MRRDRVNVLGLRLDALSYAAAVEQIHRMVQRGGQHMVCFNSLQDVALARKEPRFKRIVERADLALPDGWPVVWIMRRLGVPQQDRTTGPDLMLEVCGASVEAGHRHFLYGGADGVVEQLSAELQESFPGIRIVGSYTPPFRPLTPEEEAEVVGRINSSGADYLWVGLSTPKQHYWAEEYMDRLQVPVTFVVGAAFDFHCGRVPRAPRWMRRNRLEWLHRIWQEPRRLGPRYLRSAPSFVRLAVKDLLGLAACC